MFLYITNTLFWLFSPEMGHHIVYEYKTVAVTATFKNSCLNDTVLYFISNEMDKYRNTSHICSELIRLNRFWLKVLWIFRTKVYGGIKANLNDQFWKKAYWLLMRISAKVAFSMIIYRLCGSDNIQIYAYLMCWLWF